MQAPDLQSDKRSSARPEASLGYTLHFREQLIGKCWGTARAHDGGSDAVGAATILDCALELHDNVALNMRAYRRRCRTGLDAQGRPVFHEAQDSLGTSSKLSRKELAAADIILESNILPYLSFSLAGRADDAAVLVLNAYIVSVAAVHPLTFERNAQGWSSSLGEQIEVDASGHIVRLQTASPDVFFQRAELRAPRWRLERVAAAAASPPQRADVRVRSTDGAFTSRGRPFGYTFVAPADAEACTAAALFVGGSGFYDRHGRTPTVDLGYHELLEGLADRGIASLRFDRYGDPTLFEPADFAAFDLPGMLDDAEMADRELSRLMTAAAAVPRLLIGHSLGGLLCLALSSRLRQVDAVVLLSTPGRPLDVIMREQRSWASEVFSYSEAGKRQLAEDQEAFFEALVKATDQSPLSGRFALMEPRRRFLQQILKMDPQALVKSSSGAVLAIQGERDVQVTELDLAALQAAAAAGGRPFRGVLLPGLDHLFRAAADTGVTHLWKYGDRRRRITKRTFQRISNEIRKTLTPGRA